MRNKIIPLSLLIMLIAMIFNEAYCQTRWPFPNGARGTVVGSVGEFRRSQGSTNRRFHKGLDLVNGTDLSVHAIEGGRVTYYDHNGTWNVHRSYVRVGNVFYIHVRPTDDIINGVTTQVNRGDHIGEMFTVGINAHVHLQENDVNFLDNTLSPFTDLSRPTFNTDEIDDGFAFYQNGLNHATTNADAIELDDQVRIGTEDYLLLYNKVDIAAHITDVGVNTDGSGNAAYQLAPYQITWKVKPDEDSNQIKAADSLLFDDIPNNNAANVSFHPNSRHGRPSVHIATSSPSEMPYDRYWNTVIKKNVTQNWPTDNSLNAKHILDAALPDSLYLFQITGSDVDYDDNPNLTTPVRSAKVLVDNFFPFVQKVEVYNVTFGFEDLIYRGEWKKDGEELKFDETQIDFAEPETNLRIRVQMSEPLQTAGIRRPFMSVASKPGINHYPTVTANGGTEFTWELDFTTFDDSDLGEQRLIFTGNDLAGNNLMPLFNETRLTEAKIPQRQLNGNWIPSYGSPLLLRDRRHVFIIETTTCPSPGGRTTGDCPLIAEFTHEATSPNNQTVQFTDISVPVDLITAWDWDFGDGDNSNEQNPLHSYALAGEYDVELTVWKGLTESSSYQLTITVEEDDDFGLLESIFTMSPDKGPAPLVVSLNSNGSTGSIARRTWSISPNSGYSIASGQNLNSPTLNLTFADQGEYEITLKVEDGVDYDESTQTVTVEPAPGDFSVDFEWDEPLFANAQTQFRSIIGPGSCVVSDYIWTFDKGGFWESTQYGYELHYTFIEPRDYVVELAVMDNCNKRVVRTKIITVTQGGNYAVPFYTGGDGIIRTGQTVKFIDQSTPRDQLDSWYWKFELPPDLEGPANCVDLGYCSNVSYRHYRPSVEHVYTQPGQYKARLAVTTDWFNFNNHNFYDKIINVVPDWGVSVPVQTETQIITNNDYHNPPWPGKSIDVNGNFYVGNLVTMRDYQDFVDNVLQVYKKVGNDWVPHTQFTRPERPEDGFSHVAMNDNAVYALSWNGGLDIFSKNGDWESSNSPSLSMPNIPDLVRFKAVAASGSNIALLNHPRGGNISLTYNLFNNAYVYLDEEPDDIAMSGNIVVIGNADSNNAEVYEYTKVGDVESLTKVATLTSTLGEIDAENSFGISVDIDGDVIVVGTGYQNRPNSSHPFIDGGAYIFEKPAGGWKDMTESSRLTAFDGQTLGEFHYGFGGDVSISGGRIAVLAGSDRTGTGCGGDNEYNNPPCTRGSVYVYEKTANGWESSTQHAKLVSSESSQTMPYMMSWQGDQIALSDEEVIVANYIDGENWNGGTGLTISTTGKYHIFKLDDTYLPVCNETYAADLFIWDISPNSPYLFLPAHTIKGNLIFGGSGAVEVVPGYQYHPAAITSSDQQGSIEFRGSNIQLKKGFTVTRGADVTFKPATCSELIILDNN